MSDYPEHDKLHEIADASQTIGEFLDYGLGEQGLVLCDDDGEGGRLWPTSKSIQSILAEHFGIDQDKINAEKEQMLERIRSLNA
jgi:hypothetical protein